MQCINRNEALNCEINCVHKTDDDYKFLISQLESSISRSHDGELATIKCVFRISRPEEVDRYNPSKLDNEEILYHGSRQFNWVGILSRGLLLPKIVLSNGGKRTDGGWLGDGIYFGDADTASFYACIGSNECAYFLDAKVALGKMKKDFIVHMEILAMKVNLMIRNIVFMMKNNINCNIFIEFEKIQLLHAEAAQGSGGGNGNGNDNDMNGNGSSDSIINGINVSRYKCAIAGTIMKTKNVFIVAFHITMLVVAIVCTYYVWEYS